MRKIFFNDVNQTELAQKGYTLLPLLSESEVAYLLAELSGLKPNDNFAPNGNGGFLFTYHCSFLDTSVHYKRQASKLLREVFAPHVKRHLVGYEILNCNFYVKPPGTGELTIHQNWHPLRNLNDTSLTVWCPLVDTNKTNGTLELVEGSHKIVSDIATLGCPPYFRDFKPALIEKYLKPMPMKAGGGVIFDDSLVHWSARNDSGAPRIAIQLICVPTDAETVYYHFDKNQPDRFEVFEADSDFFIENTITDLVPRPKGRRSLGFVENNNRLITETEFARLLENGEQIRRQRVYFPEKTNKRGGKSTFFGKIKAMINLEPDGR